MIVIVLANLYQGSATENIEADLLNINQAYQINQHYSMEIVYKVFPTHESETPIQVEKGIIKKDGYKYYSKIGQIETLKTLEEIIVIDNESKYILLSDRHLNDDSDANDLLQMDLSKLLNDYASSKKYAINSLQQVYEINPDLGEYKKIKLFYNTKNYFIEKLELYYNHSIDDAEENSGKLPMLEITYNDINLKPVFAGNELSANKYIMNNQLVSAYEGYQFINNKLNIHATEK